MSVIHSRLAVVALFLAASAYAFAGGEIARESRPTSGFDRVVLHGVGDLIISQADTEALVIEAEKRLLPKISTEVKGGTLHFDFTEREISTRYPLRYHLTVKNLSGIASRGSGDIKASRLTAGTFEITMAGSGNASIDALSAKALTVNMPGAANVEIGDGSVATQSVTIKGSGDYTAPKLKTGKSSVQISGSGSAELWASDALDVNIVGSGEVRYRGNPKVQRSVTGSGNVTRLAGY